MSLAFCNKGRCSKLFTRVSLFNSVMMVFSELAFVFVANYKQKVCIWQRRCRPRKKN